MLSGNNSLLTSEYAKRLENAQLNASALATGISRVQGGVEEVDGVGHNGTDSVKLGKGACAVAANLGRESARLNQLGCVKTKSLLLKEVILTSE